MRVVHKLLWICALSGLGCGLSEGQNGDGCHVTDNADGSVTVECKDGSTATIRSGADGANGVGTLTRTVSIPAGELCEFGGYQVEIGEDYDQDGILADSEITAVLYRSCVNAGFEINGSVEIRDGLDLLFLEQVKSISGDLVLLSSEITELRAPILTTVTGSLDLSQGAALRLLEMPQLLEVGGDILTITGSGEQFRAAQALESIRLPSLLAVQGRFIIGSSLEGRSLPLLAELEIPSLESAAQLEIYNVPITELLLQSYLSGDELAIMNNPELSLISTPLVSDVKRLAIADNGHTDEPFTIIGLDSLFDLGGMYFSQANYTDDLSIPFITTSSEIVISSGSSAIHMSSLTSISLNLSIYSCMHLTELDLPQLTYVPDLYLADNPLLGCEFRDFIEQLNPPPDSVFEDNNGECSN